ncbi:MazG-like family protein [Sporolactobacillus shoreicorticis]|uniref:MazG-like family protein n=1 Tax=Sporolactobacillus shoreicorticis TaxID=1923877 RepID=A0ABW5S574_9BACL|nr:MazG-like family protein [Sporolactobacillus shoreicorticis]MCO7127658.1 MazG-like family protein [Sporolactobacillus shoreicorticis]
MNLKEVQEWEKQFYEKRGWKGLPPYIRVGFLMEEMGEVSRAVRAYEIGRDHPGESAETKDEIRQNLSEEIGDALSNLAILADLYHLSLEDVVSAHRSKLTKRYQEQG